jgi:hypothetical protein
MNPTCPNCGGTQVRQITPGFFECESRVLVGVVPLEVSGQPAPIPDYRICGRRFQAGKTAETPLCACGRYSIGRCSDCARPLCGEHGTANSPFLCDECVTRRATAARRQHAITDLETARAAGADAKSDRERICVAIREAFGDALAAQEAQLRAAVPAFLASASHITPKSISIGVKRVDSPRQFLRKPITEYETVNILGHLVHKGRPMWSDPDQVPNDVFVYVLQQGQVLFEKQTPHRRTRAMSASYTGEEVDVAGVDLSVTLVDRLPFHVGGSDTPEIGPGMRDPRERAESGYPDLPYLDRCMEEVERTTSWFMRALAGYPEVDGR